MSFSDVVLDPNTPAVEGAFVPNGSFRAADGVAADEGADGAGKPKVEGSAVEGAANETEEVPNVAVGLGVDPNAPLDESAAAEAATADAPASVGPGEAE